MKNLFRTKLTALLLALAGLMCASSAMAWTISAGDVYFDNTVTGWSNVYIRFGTTSWCTVYEMSKVEGNDNIYMYTFPSDANDIDAIQFASTDGYKVTTSCNSDCGIYNGNVIGNGNKTEYYKGNISGDTRLMVATGNVNFCAMSGPYPMPSSVAYGATYLGGGSVTAGATVGYFTAGQELAFSGAATLGYGSTTPSTDKVHATFRYYLDGTDYTDVSCAGEGSAIKPFSTTVEAPEAVGKYTMSSFYRCGGKSSDTITSYYHVIGLTGHDLNFGAVKKDGSLAKTESLTDVWGGDGVNTVTASIKDGTYFKFTDETSGTKSIAITDKAGEVSITFAPTDYSQHTDTLTLSITYNTNQTLTKKYVLSGTGRNDNATVIKSSKATVLIGPKATLHAYIQYTGCDSITERGFYYSKTATISESNGTIITSDETSELVSGDTWECTIPTSGNLETNTTYYYRPYIKTSGKLIKFSETDYTFQTADACNYDLSGDTIYMQVDKSFAADGDSVCTLKFRELQGAIDFIKGSSVFYNSTTKVLNYNIVLEVAPASANYIGTGTTSTTGGEGTDLSTIIFQDINNTTDVSTGYDKSLVIRSSSATQMPTIQHPTIRNSRNITFENVRITGSLAAGASTNKYDNAVDIDVNDSGWTGLVVGKFANANINFKSCYIYSMGFTCLHVSAYDGVTFEDCDIEADLPEGSAGKGNPNTIKWGASVKFIQCKNIKFLRNNFRGSHATSIWMQGVIGMLAMNNVFWNDNDAYNATYKENGAFFRFVTQQANDDATKANLNKKIGIYYNTLYINADTTVTDERHFDYIRLGSYYDDALKANLTQNEASSIRFMYNNCYSYDMTSVVGSNQEDGDYKWCLTADEDDWCESINKNNYWSRWDGKTKNFIVPDSTTCAGTSKYYTVNVYEQVCKTASDDPGTLVIKGDGLNYGSHIETDISGLGDNTYYNDRLHASNGADAVRKTDGEWTLGAYQQGAASDPIETIVWWGDETGDESNWDNRNNWRKLDGTRVTCVDNFATDLKVIIPAPNSTTYPIPEGGITTYPFLPSKFSGTRTYGTQETVNSGHGIDNPSKFASSIEVEAGAAILGVTSLADDGGRYYDEVTNHFEAGREEWILVGTVVKPFTDDNKNAVRLIQSADYFIANHEPHVYMRQAYVNGDTANWNTPFTSLEEEVDYDKVFAIDIPNQYGPYKLKAYRYYAKTNPSMTGDGTVSKTFDFNGWFLNDEIYPEYKVSGATLICNTYPANIDVASAAELNSGTVYYYDYSVKNFVSYDPKTGLDKEIKSQNGFLFVPSGSNDGYFRISKEMLLSTSTKYKSAVAVNPFFYLLVSNANGAGGSVAAIIYDELKSDEYDSDVDMINKTIDNTTTQPEISVEMYGKELDKVYVPDLTQAIPLKLVCGAKMTVEFAKYSVGDMETVTLEDRETGNTYDLLNETASIALAKGTYKGRFYLNLSEAEEPLPTDVDDVTSGDASIDIYGDSKAVIISSSENVILKGAEITDMAGRTTYVELTGAHYNKVNISGAQGVYVVKAIGDVMSETTKVIVK